jgi:hypothetical protein
MTGGLTFRPRLWRRGVGSVAVIRRRRHPCLEINRKAQNLRQKSHSQRPAAPNKRLSTGILARFDDNGVNEIVAFEAQDCCCERRTFDWK